MREMPAFCVDSELGYHRSRTDFTADTPLRLDESYRLAHLPLIAPEHPGVIAHRDSKFYEMGRHPRVFSLVLPVDDAELRRSEAFLRLEGELKTSRFAHKIAWSLLPKRCDRLHATLCGSLAADHPPLIAPEQREALAALGPFDVELRGLFSGNVNRGRLYLKAYPETRGGRNMIQALQAALARPPTDLYLVGLYNLTEDLDLAETAELADLIARWQDAPLLRMRASDLWLLGACDDLVLDAAVAETLSLDAAAYGRLPRLRP